MLSTGCGVKSQLLDAQHLSEIRISSLNPYKSLEVRLEEPALALETCAFSKEALFGQKVWKLLAVGELWPVDQSPRA